MPVVKLPDGTHVSFPDDMPMEQIRAIIANKLPASSPEEYKALVSGAKKRLALQERMQDLPEQKFLPGLMDKITQGVTLGLGDELSAFLDAGILGRTPEGDWFDYSKSFKERYQDALAVEREQQRRFGEKHPYISTTAEITGAVAPAIATLGQSAPASVASIAKSIAPMAAKAGNIAKTISPAIKIGKGAGALTRAGKGAATAGSLGALYGFNSGEGGMSNRLDNAIRVGLPSAALGASGPYLAKGAAWAGKKFINSRLGAELTKRAPSIEELKSQARKLYAAGEQYGKTANPKATNTFVENLHHMAKNEGLISPKGRVNSAYPKISSILNHAQDFNGMAMTPKHMLAIRKLIKGAAKSTEPSEKRIAQMLLRKMDDFTQPHAPEFNRANKLYQRAKNAELIDKMTDLASVRASQYSQSGLENALRTEFRALDRAQIKNRLPGLRNDQIKAVQRVARGSRAENVFRSIGKLAPTSVLSAGVSGGVPFMIGNAIGGPGIGLTASGITMGTGAISRKIATRLQKKHVKMAKALMTTAKPLPEVKFKVLPLLIENYLRYGSHSIGGLKAQK